MDGVGVMYIFIFEDGSAEKSQIFTEGDKISVSEGILEVIDISEPNKPVTYYNETWHDLEETNYIA